ncbi:MAG: hypothetical protein KKA55_11865 [Proteobacteria bacterium]|nr:hypothetical protein [Pseudomonadota bacterium]MBU1596213.1 hypothetical protein [Pseudomonadota bacterium]
MTESYLENALTKLARQIVAFDEASLMDLWEKYAEAVRRFEPTRRWEESALIFGVIQSVRMKNQLFNYNLAASRSGAPGPGLGLDMLNLTAPEGRPPAADSETGPGRAPADSKPAPRGSARQGKPKAGKLISLRPDLD